MKLVRLGASQQEEGRIVERSETKLEFAFRTDAGLLRRHREGREGGEVRALLDANLQGEFTVRVSCQDGGSDVHRLDLGGAEEARNIGFGMEGVDKVWLGKAWAEAQASRSVPIQGVRKWRPPRAVLRFDPWLDEVGRPLAGSVEVLLDFRSLRLIFHASTKPPDARRIPIVGDGRALLGTPGDAEQMPGYLRHGRSRL